MKEKGTDILNSLSLKTMPYDVPEGYFGTFRNKVKKGTAVPRIPIWSRLAPYAGLAASFAAIFLIGMAVLDRPGKSEMSMEEYLLFTDASSLSAIYDIEAESQLADADINDEDIIEYLIYSGITAEEIEQFK